MGGEVRQYPPLPPALKVQQRYTDWPCATEGSAAARMIGTAATSNEPRLRRERWCEFIKPSFFVASSPSQRASHERSDAARNSTRFEIRRKDFSQRRARKEPETARLAAHSRLG